MSLTGLTDSVLGNSLSMKCSAFFLQSLHVPTAIGRIRVNPELCAVLPFCQAGVPVWSSVAGGDGARQPLAADIDIGGHNADDVSSMIEIEDLVIKSFAPATVADGRRVFSSTKSYI